MCALVWRSMCVFYFVSDLFLDLIFLTLASSCSFLGPKLAMQIEHLFVFPPFSTPALFFLVLVPNNKYKRKNLCFSFPLRSDWATHRPVSYVNPDYRLKLKIQYFSWLYLSHLWVRFACIHDLDEIGQGCLLCALYFNCYSKDKHSQ